MAATPLGTVGACVSGVTVEILEAQPPVEVVAKRRDLRRAARGGARARGARGDRAVDPRAGAATAASRRPSFEGTELFARGVGESTDIVQKEMYTFEDGGGRSLTLRPEGTAPICRAYVEHGMHKLPQPAKLWYLSCFFRYERAQAGPLPAVLADRRRGDRLRRPGRRRRAHHAARDAAGRGRVSRRAAPAGEPRLPRGPRRVPRGAAGATCARTRTSSPTRSAAASTSTRCARSTPTIRARGRSWSAPRGCWTASPPTTPSTSPRSARCSTRAGVDYEIDPSLVRGLDYYTRTVFEFTSDALGAQSGVGGGGRYDGLVEQLGGPPTPGCGWAAGVERIRLAGHRAADGAAAGRPLRRARRPRRTGGRVRASPPRRAARGWRRSWSWRAAR